MVLGVEDLRMLAMVVKIRYQKWLKMKSKLHPNAEGVREKTCFADVYVRGTDGEWSRGEPLSHVVGEGVTCETPRGVFCAGGYDGAKVYSDAYVLTGSGVEALPTVRLSVAAITRNAWAVSPLS